MSVPFIELGVGGAFAVILIDRVLGWTIKFKNERNGKSVKCIYTAEVKDAILNNILTRGSVDRIEKHIETLSKQSIEQTGILRQQYETLKEIAKNSKS